jgi:hypothetical protein
VVSRSSIYPNDWDKEKLRKSLEGDANESADSLGRLASPLRDDSAGTSLGQLEYVPGTPVVISDAEDLPEWDLF